MQLAVWPRPTRLTEAHPCHPLAATVPAACPWKPASYAAILRGLAPCARLAPVAAKPVLANANARDAQTPRGPAAILGRRTKCLRRCCHWSRDRRICQRCRARQGRPRRRGLRHSSCRVDYDCGRCFVVAHRSQVVIACTLWSAPSCCANASSVKTAASTVPIAAEGEATLNCASYAQPVCATQFACRPLKPDSAFAFPTHAGPSCRRTTFRVRLAPGHGRCRVRVAKTKRQDQKQPSSEGDTTGWHHEQPPASAPHQPGQTGSKQLFLSWMDAFAFVLTSSPQNPFCGGFGAFAGGARWRRRRGRPRLAPTRALCIG